MPVRVMKLLGIEKVILSNAAGGISDTFKVGDVMILKDHINLMGFAGLNALMGKEDLRLVPLICGRFRKKYGRVVSAAVLMYLKWWGSR